MGDRLEKLRKINYAAKQDETPLVRALITAKVEHAWRTKGDAKANRELGDVQFFLGALQYSIESQVATPGHVNFSYSDSKVTLYRGASYERAYTMLGCYESKNDDSMMIFTVIPARTLHEILIKATYDRTDSNIFRQEEGKYWVIRPEALCSLDDAIIGESIEDVARQLVTKLMP